MRLLNLLLIIPAALVVSCSSTPNTAYTPLDPAVRNTARADELNQQAAELMSGDPAKAETLLREALAADLYHGPAHNNLGVLFLKQRKLYEAAGEFEWARKLLPGHPDPRLNLSLTLESAGRYDQAIDHARLALQIHPGHIASLQQLTRLTLLHPNFATDPRTSRPIVDTAIADSSSTNGSPSSSSLLQNPASRLDPAARDELRSNLHEIALRGESNAWKDWARLQLVKLDSAR